MFRMRAGVVIQSTDMENAHTGGNSRINVWREESAGFRGMLVGPHRKMECLFDVRDIPLHVENEAIGILAADGKAIAFGVVN